MPDKTWEFEVTEGDWMLRASYQEPDNVEIYHKGELFKTVTYMSYKIWNLQAHFKYDIVPVLEEECLKKREQNEC